jgi:hypothetical protein
VIDSIVSREIGVLTVASIGDIAVGDRLYVKLKNRYEIKSIIKEDATPGSNAIISIYSENGEGAIQHLINVIRDISDSKMYPEAIIFGTKDSTVNYDGVYHIVHYEYVEAEGVVNLKVYRASDAEDPIYNDYIGVTTVDIEGAFLHIPWPTHKFLNILIDDERYYKAYLDAPIDTIYDFGDVLAKYQTIARSASVLSDTMFPGWNEFGHFRRYHGLSRISDVLEVTKSIPGAEFGKYFPSRYEST